MRRGQSGVALITVLLVVAVVTIVCAGLIIRQQLAIRSSANQLHVRQAWHYALGGERLAEAVLRRDLRQGGENTREPVDHLGEAWARPMTPFKLDDGGELRVRIEDPSGRFNLNGLVRKRKVKPDSVKQFRRLLATLGMKEEIVQGLPDRLADWLDADQNPQGEQGAEDNQYLLEAPAYRAANRSFKDVSELRLLKLSEADYRRLLPFVSALPEDAPLNVNTASVPVLAAMFEIDPGQAENIVAARGREGFQEKTEFSKHLNELGSKASNVNFAVGTRYFQVISEVSLGDRRQVLVSTLQRGKDGKIRVMARDMGQGGLPIRRRAATIGRRTSDEWSECAVPAARQHGGGRWGTGGMVGAGWRVPARAVRPGAGGNPCALAAVPAGGGGDRLRGEPAYAEGALVAPVAAVRGGGTTGRRCRADAPCPWSGAGRRPPPGIRRAAHLARRLAGAGRGRGQGAGFAACRCRLPAGRGQLPVLAGRALVARRQRRRTLACGSEDWPVLRDSCPPPQRAFAAQEVAPRRVEVQALAGNPHVWLSEQPLGTDLAQAEFAARQQSSQWRRWRPLLGLVGLWLVLQWGFTLVQAWQLQREGDRYAAQSAELYRQLFPEDRKLINLRAQFDQHLADSASSGGEGQLLGLLGQAATVIGGEPTVSVEQLDFSAARGDVALQVRAPGFDVLERLRSRLSESGLAVQLGSASRDGSTVSARLVIGG